MFPWKLTCIDVKMADTSYVGLHLFCRISKHILPSAYTVMNRNVRYVTLYHTVNKLLFQPFNMHVFPMNKSQERFS